MSLRGSVLSVLFDDIQHFQKTDALDNRIPVTFQLAQLKELEGSLTDETLLDRLWFLSFL